MCQGVGLFRGVGSSSRTLALEFGVVHIKWCVVVSLVASKRRGCVLRCVMRRRRGEENLTCSVVLVLDSGFRKGKRRCNSFACVFLSFPDNVMQENDGGFMHISLLQICFPS